MLTLPKFSLGVGDRFGLEAAAQLRAVSKIKDYGVDVTPVWNKSHREHIIIGSTPQEVRAEADAAVADSGWTGPYFVDADHVHAGNIDPFLDCCDFFTLDVADYIGRPASADRVNEFSRHHADLANRLDIPGISEPIRLDIQDLRLFAGRYLSAVQKAAELYQFIAGHRSPGTFVTEVSMDETDRAQTPAELIVILAALADEGVPAQTIAPKFTGRFNKGVDYVGDTAVFAEEFEHDVCIVKWAAERFGLPQNLKLSVHSGSDKFSLYPLMGRALQKHNAGLHLKTAGTTWLEEVIGLAESGAEALDLARELYGKAHGRREELCAPYANVIDIVPDKLPSPEIVNQWTSTQLANALRHDPSCPDFNSDMRQLMHVAYKTAAETGNRFRETTRKHAETIGKNVEYNIFQRHLLPLFAPTNLADAP